VSCSDDSSEATDTAVVYGCDETIAHADARVISVIPTYTRRDGTETMPARKAEKPMCGVHPVSARQGEMQLRGVQPLTSRQAEIRLRGVQPLSSRQAER